MKVPLYANIVRSGDVRAGILFARCVHAGKRTCIRHSIQSVDDGNCGNYGIYYSL